MSYHSFVYFVYGAPCSLHRVGGVREGFGRERYVGDEGWHDCEAEKSERFDYPQLPGTVRGYWMSRMCTIGCRTFEIVRKVQTLGALYPRPAALDLVKIA